MGFLGGDNEQTPGSALADEQIRQNQAELELKKQSLYEQRLGIIKGQGGEQWHANRDSGQVARNNPIPGLRLKNQR